MTPEKRETMRQFFKRGNKSVIFQWRLGLGWLMNLVPPVMGQYMVLVHTGRKSGLKRYTPVNFARIGEDLYCVAGFGKEADWYQNMIAIPEIEVWLPGRRWYATAEDVSARPDALAILRAVLKGSGFASFAFGGINPYTIRDESLRQLTSDYRLIRIRRTEALAGTGEQGRYGWLLGMVMALFGVVAGWRALRRRMKPQPSHT